VPAVDGGIELHAGIAAAPGGVGNLEEQIFSFESVQRTAVSHRFRAEVGIAEDGVHEVVGHADGVIGILEKDGRIRVGIGR
jgi:hypothetical protein